MCVGGLERANNKTTDCSFSLFSSFLSSAASAASASDSASHTTPHHTTQQNAQKQEKETTHTHTHTHTHRGVMKERDTWRQEVHRVMTSRGGVMLTWAGLSASNE